MVKKIAKLLMLALSINVLVPFTGTSTKASTAPEILGATSITMDIETGEVIYSKNASELRSPASTTKLLSSLLFAESKSKDDIITYTDVSAGLKETVLGDFMSSPVIAGDTMTAEDVMEAVLIYSANDTAILMAEAVSGDIDSFAEIMNKRAKEIGAENSTFYNPSGLENPENPSVNNSTTAYDLALIAIEAYKNDWIRETMTLNEATVSLKGLPIYIEPRNLILGENGNVGGKTGNETLAEHCFAGFYERDGRELVTVVLGTDYGDGTNVFADTEKIADYSYKATKVPYKNSGDEVLEITLDYKLFGFFGPENTITVPVTTNTDLLYYDNDYNKENANISYTSENLNAWNVAKNNEVKLSFNIGNHTEEFSALANISTTDLFKANAPVYIAVILGFVIVIALVIIIIRIISKKRNKKNSYRSRYYS